MRAEASRCARKSSRSHHRDILVCSVCSVCGRVCSSSVCSVCSPLRSNIKILTCGRVGACQLSHLSITIYACAIILCNIMGYGRQSFLEKRNFSKQYPTQTVPGPRRSTMLQ